MTFLDRLVGFALALFAATMAAIFFAVAIGWNAVPTISTLLTTMSVRAWETGLSAIVLLLASFHLISVSLPRRTERAIVRETALGQVRVHLRAIEHSVYRSVRVIKGVRDVDAHVTPTATGVDVRVVLAVAPDLALPDLADEVQHNVERYIQDTVGLSVGTVTVEVRAVTGETKARVE